MMIRGPCDFCGRECASSVGDSHHCIRCESPTYRLRSLLNSARQLGLFLTIMSVITCVVGVRNLWIMLLLPVLIVIIVKCLVDAQNYKHMLAVEECKSVLEL